MRLTLLGGCALASSNGTIIRLKSRKSWALLSLLAQAQETGCSREYITGLLWPQSGEAQARASLRQELSVLRRMLRDDDPAVLEARPDRIFLNSASMQIDSQELACLSHANGAIDPEKIISLYQGDFAAGLTIRSAPFHDWLWLERERLRGLAIATLERSLCEADPKGDPERKLRIARSIIEIEPTRETAHQHVMRVLQALGRRTEALAHFARFQDIMKRELDVAPSEDTVDLYHSLRDGHEVREAPSAGAGTAVPPRFEKRDLSVAAFGIAAASSAEGGLGAEEVSDLLIKLEAHSRKIIDQHGGTFLGVVGDRCLAVFGYPASGELMAERCVFAALHLMQGETRVSLPDHIQISCGIANGETLIAVTEDQMLEPRHFSGTAVTQATALSFTASGGQLLINAKAKALLRHAFQIEPVPNARDHLSAYQVLGDQIAPNRFDASRKSRTLTQFVGRNREMSRLKGLWAKATQGDGGIVCVLGEPGIGKSRLVHAFLRSGIGEEAAIMQFVASAHHQNTAYYPVVQELRRVLDIFPDASSQQVRWRVEKWAAGMGFPFDEANNALLISLLGGENGQSKQDQTPREKTEQALLTTFIRLAQEKPILLVFEDLHWMDPSSKRLIQSLQATANARKMMMVITSRYALGLTEKVPSRPNWIRLKRLSPAQSLKVARGIWPRQLDQHHLTDIIERSDGIPLFLEELIQGVSEEAGRNRSVTPKRAVPFGLKETLTARVDRMGSEKEILHLASVIGRVFRLSILYAAAPYRQRHIDEYLARLQQQDLVYQVGGAPDLRYEFKHALVQELTYGSILRADRQRYHNWVAKALKSGDALLPAEPEVIAHHFEQAAEIEDAISYLERAGKQAVRVSAHDEAVEHFRRALALARAQEETETYRNCMRRLLLLLGPQLLAQHGFASDEVKEVYNQALALANGAEDKRALSRVLWGLWSNDIVRAKLDVSDASSRAFLDIALRTRDGADIIAGHYMTGVARFYTGQLPEAQAAFDAAMAAYCDDLHDEMILRFGLNLGVAAASYLLWTYALIGQIDHATQQTEALLGRTQAISHPVSGGFAHNFVSRFYNFLGDAARAAYHARLAIDLAEGQKFAQFRAQANINLGRALDSLGQPQGVDFLEKGLAGYLETGAELARPYTHAWLAEAYLVRGRISQAEKNLNEALAFSARTGEVYFDAELLRLRGELAARFSIESFSAVRTRFDRALETAYRMRAGTLALLTSASYARALEQRGAQAGAQEIAQRALKELSVEGKAPICDHARAELLRLSANSAAWSVSTLTLAITHHFSRRAWGRGIEQVIQVQVETL
ncbi:MAG: AAA family ATPase [Pseudomonadota bacterium]